MIDQIRVSVSQVKKYKRCERAWWYEYGPMKDKSPPTPSTALGSKVHDILEKYLLEGTEPPDNKAGRIASCGLDKLPDAAGLSIEESITLPLSENSKILCRIDMLGTDRPYIGDHKTTSDFKWAQTRAELDGDVQLLTYAYAAYHEEKPPKVDAELIYYRTRGLPVSMSVKTSLKWEDIKENWEKMGEIAEEMAPKKSDPNGDSCGGNSSACSDYGGCYHAPKCPFSPKNRKNTIAQVYSHDNMPVETTKKETEKMDDKTKSIQNIFGILAPDAPPEAVQTTSLEESTAASLKNMVSQCGGSLPGETVKNFLIRAGISPENYPDVLTRAGVTLNPDGVVTVTAPAAPVAAPVAAPAAPAAVNTSLLPEKKVIEYAQKRCTVETLRGVGADLAMKTRAKEGGLAEDTARAWAAGVIAPSSLSEKRWNRIVEFSGLVLDGCWLHTPDRKGYTVDVEAAPTGADADRAAYEAKTGKTAPVAVAVQPTATAAPVAVQPTTTALNHPFIVLVDASFNRTPSTVMVFSVWVMTHVQTLEDREQKSFYLLDADFGKGPKLLAGVIAAALHAEAPAGVISMDSSHPLAGAVLPLFERAGALIIYGR